jgi:hypothetical protein
MPVRARTPAKAIDVLTTFFLFLIVAPELLMGVLNLLDVSMIDVQTSSLNLFSMGPNFDNHKNKR